MKRIHHLLLSLLLIPVVTQAQVDTIFSAPDSLDYLTKPVPPSTSTIDVEEDTLTDGKRVFMPKYMNTDDTFHLRSIPAATLKGQKEDKDFWYANYNFKKKILPEKEPTESPEPFIFHPAFETILWIIVGVGFLTFLILFLRNGNIGILRSSKNIPAEEPGTTADFDDIFSIDYQQQIDKAAGEGNYNLAVRLLYLRLLRGLAERNIIDYKQDRTNFDYLLQLQQTRYYKDFFRLTRHYEYSWYGQFQLAQNVFAKIREQFETFDRNLN